MLNERENKLANLECNYQIWWSSGKLHRCESNEIFSHELNINLHNLKHAICMKIDKIILKGKKYFSEKPDVKEHEHRKWRV